jgi:hypothetical protein
MLAMLETSRHDATTSGLELGFEQHERLDKFDERRRHKRGRVATIMSVAF